uniref:Cytochrome c oxidase polypeptide VIa n=2 Tax=Clastoptera arizonana TaxID=38151 RepID=A0A1B6D8X7_9HEMI
MAGISGLVFKRLFSKSIQNYNAVEGPSAVSGSHGDAGMKLWRNLSFFVGLPAVILCALNAYLKHLEEDHTPPEFVAYEHLRIRNKRFPWGDGSRSLFHNPHTNALPTGYEEAHH